VKVLDNGLNFYRDPCSNGGKKQMMDPLEKPPFKFVEHVRKKAKGENLQGATCKLCK